MNNDNCLHFPPHDDVFTSEEWQAYCASCKAIRTFNYFSDKYDRVCEECNSAYDPYALIQTDKPWPHWPEPEVSF